MKKKTYNCYNFTVNIHFCYLYFTKFHVKEIKDKINLICVSDLYSKNIKLGVKIWKLLGRYQVDVNFFK